LFVLLRIKIRVYFKFCSVETVKLKTQLQATAAHQEKQLDALSAALQKVSAQLEMSKAAPQTVLNNQ